MNQFAFVAFLGCLCFKLSLPRHVAYIPLVVVMVILADGVTLVLMSLLRQCLYKYRDLHSSWPFFADSKISCFLCYIKFRNSGGRKVVDHPQVSHFEDWQISLWQTGCEISASDEAAATAHVEAVYIHFIHYGQCPPNHCPFPLIQTRITWQMSYSVQPTAN